MGKSSKKPTPGSVQDSGAPQDETPGMWPDGMKNKNSSPGVKKTKPKPEHGSTKRRAKTT